jgi:ABC-type lipoprotein export system ATPase subunit
MLGVGKTLLMVTHNKQMSRQVPRVVEIVDGYIAREENNDHNGRQT